MSLHDAKVGRAGALRWLWRPAARRSAVRLSADVLGRIIQLVVLVVIARSVDEATFGTLVLGSTAGLIIGQASDLGLMLTVASDIARSVPRVGVAVGSALATKTGLALLALPIYLAIFMLLGSDGAALGAALLATALALDSFVQFSATSLRAAGAFWQDWLVAVVPRAATLLFVVPVTLAFRDPAVIGAAWLAASILAAGFAVWRLASRVTISAAHRATIRGLIHRSWPIGASIVAGMAYTRMGIFTLEALRSSSEVAVYAVASRLVEPAYLIPAAGVAIFFPSYARTLHERPASARQQLTRWVVAMAAIGLITYGILAVGGPLISSLLFGEFYAASGELLVLLALVVVPGFVSYLLNQALIADGHARYNLTVMGILLAASVVGNIALVGRFGTWGAAAVAVAIELVLIAALLHRAFKRPA